MPELAEVEFYRKEWDAGKGQPITFVAMHAEKRIFRCTDSVQLRSALTGSRLLASEANGKQMLFRFSGDRWLGIHLGMTGELSLQSRDFVPGKHDHFVLFQKKAALVFSDMRQFGLVRFDQGPEPPRWWSDLGIAVSSPQFTLERMRAFLQAHSKLAIKPALLIQKGFPGVGNWMADEILWRSRIHPQLAAGKLNAAQLRRLWREVRFVCRQALRRIEHAFSDPPKNWLFHQRWSARGRCPRDGQPLVRETIGGRTSAWCPCCQPRNAKARRPLSRRVRVT